MLRMAVCTVFLVALGGCAALNSIEPAPDNVDHKQVAAIERAARASGVQVIWLRMPTKPASAAAGS
jgi:hypothetical protein